MNFGLALDAVKAGKKTSREGWNGKGMFIYLNKGNVDKNAPNTPPGLLSVEGISVDLFENGADGTVTRLPNINMKAATGSTVTGWLASQTDLLADDWGIVE